MINDAVSDMLARIRNAQARSYVEVKMPHSTLCVNVLNVLKEEGYINSYEIKDVRKNIKEIIIGLRYDKLGKPAIQKSWRVSKPGRRVYFGCKKLPKILNGLGSYVLSTPKGVMSDFHARKAMVGGEVLCALY